MTKQILLLLCTFALHGTCFAAIDCDVIQNKIKEVASKGGGIVKVAAGDYVCRTPIIIDTDNIQLIGESAGPVTSTGRSKIGELNQVRLKLADNVNSPVLIIGSPNSKVNDIPAKIVRNIKVQNLDIDGNRANQSTEQASECWEGLINKQGCQDAGRASVRNNCITIRGAEDIEVSEVRLSNARSGGIVTEKYCRRLTISRIISTKNFFDGFAGYRTEASVIRDSILDENEGAGASLDLEFNYNRFINVSFSKNKHQGVFARFLHGVDFERSGFIDNGYQGLFLANNGTPGYCANNIRVLGGTIQGSGALQKGLAQGIRINNDDCRGSCVYKTKFSKNNLADISHEKGPIKLADYQCGFVFPEDYSSRTPSSALDSF